MNLIDIKKQFDTDITEIDNSKIKNAGYGVFAKKDIKKGTKLGEYIGERIDKFNVDKYDIDKIKKSNYRMVVGNLPDIVIVDASIDFIDKTNWTRYLNSTKTINSKKLNAYTYQYNRKIYVKAIKDIKKGEEILIYYGNDFWNK